ncbi:MAG: MFS transporter [Hyphomicrobiales bacterium]|nr:MFS transporter [Hyphomicrobiales bacterium]
MTWRFVPFLVVCYFVAYLDRVNVGFAKLTMDADIGLSDTMFGFGAGVFFLAYFVFEVPSNLLLDKFGARVWIARIMFSWGLISGAMAFVPDISRFTGLSGEHTFYALRILLGFAEAGFLPGIIYFLTLWFPATYRARIVGYFMSAVPLSSALGSPVSAWLLGFDGLGGLKGWQWLFVAEAAPSLILAVVTYFYLTDRPAEAMWLDAAQRKWLIGRLAAEDKARAHVSPAGALASLYDARVLAMSLIYFGVVACLYGVGFWLPTIVKGFGVSIAMTGWISAIPYLVGFVGMMWWGMRSDARMERTLHLAIPLALAAIGVGGAAFLTDPLAKMIALTVGAFGVYATLPVFWTLPTAILSGASAAAGIAAINAIGNLSGYFGPFVIGWIKDATGSFAWGLLAVAACSAVAMVIALALGHDVSLEAEPKQPAAS